ncbi:MAG: hypothetical protein AAF363_07455 [Bacteroidota bacterium]
MAEINLKLQDQLVGKYAILKNFKDRLKWHNLIKLVDINEDFSESEKKLIKNSYRELSRILGKGFLTEASQSNHFLFQHFLNLAPDAIRWSIWLAEALKALEKYDEDQTIISKLKSSRSSHEGFAILQLTYMFHKANFAIEFEPKIQINNNYKFPDVKIINEGNNESIIIEVSNINISDQHDWNKGTFHDITKTLWNDALYYNLHYCGHLRHFEEEEKASAIQRIFEAKQKAISKRGFVVVDENGIKLGIAHGDKIEKLQSWAKENNMTQGITGESISLDSDIERLKNKIKKKTKQLSEDCCNVISIPVHTLFMIGVDKLEMILQIHEYLHRFPNVYGVLIYGENPLLQEQKKIVYEKNILVNRARSPIRISGYFFIYNSQSDYQLSDQTWDMFAESFDH